MVFLNRGCFKDFFVKLWIQLSVMGIEKSSDVQIPDASSDHELSWTLDLLDSRVGFEIIQWIGVEDYERD